MKKIFCVFGTRPEAIKMAPVCLELKRQKKYFQTVVCVTAQHREMLDDVLRLFHISPRYDLNVMRHSQTLTDITSDVLRRLSPILEKEKPDLVLVHGDTTTTLAAALAAYYHRIPVAHVEAGLRSRDMFNPYPEEANRVITDSLCDILLAPTAQARRNLLEENVPAGKIFVTGNTVIDALLRTSGSRRPPAARCSGGRMILVTAHRRENFGPPLEHVCAAIRRVVRAHPDVRIVYPVHLNPNVQKTVRRRLAGVPRIELLPPVGYVRLVGLMKEAYFVVTDSGGIQEEAPSLGKPVLVLRKVTERPEAVAAGTVRVVGTDEERVFRWMSRLLTDSREYRKMANAVNPYGDGRAAERTVHAIRYYFGFSRSRPGVFRPGKSNR
ncbi:MAG TPA: UDP-N-acetylglucosamine 2-epimerase (non-hydrolyzing) [Elusimicrobiota bacterium]|nr:UDP-N-acetylglucosamine 2-epimerase (non-hydrolyzing) [Elusimicrobiota bacterium]